LIYFYANNALKRRGH